MLRLCFLKVKNKDKTMNGNYRKCVGITVYKDHKVLLCERRDLPGAWQFPQGESKPAKG